MSPPGRTRIVSHRGGALLWPENSLTAFRNSLALGVDLLECDVHLSADGIPVVIHDATLDRTTHASGTISGRSAAELGRIALRHGQADVVPRLEELAGLLSESSAGLQVEIKGPGRFDVLQNALQVMDAAKLRPRTSIIAFDAAIAAAAVSAGALADVAWLFDAGTLRRIGAAGVVCTAAACGVPTVESDIGVIDAELCGILRQAGLRIGAWGANDTQSLQHAFGLGLDLVATDDPSLALKLRP